MLNHEELKLAMFMSKTLISSIMSFTKREKFNTEERNRKSTDIYEERNRPPFGPSKDVYNSLEAPIFTRPDLRNDYSASNSSRDLDTRSRGIQESQYSMSRDPFDPIPPVSAPLLPVTMDNDYPIVSRPRDEDYPIVSRPRDEDYPIVSKPREHKDYPIVTRPREHKDRPRYPRDEYPSKRGLSPRLSSGHRDEADFDFVQQRGLRGHEEDYKLSKRIR